MPVLLSWAVTAFTVLSPLSATSTFRSMRGSSAAAAAGAVAPAVIIPAAVTAAAVLLQLRARCAMVPPPEDPPDPRAVDRRRIVGIAQSGEQGAHRIATRVTRFTGVRDQEMATTPPTGERPQE
ncbi:hypothetical protein ABZ178_14940 [Streptomyces massasporeus]|uniref:hypothetical protein n=1 Tax=Streptomyces massasporeus TaxID=67324 RepID=UPI0033A0F378